MRVLIDGRYAYETDLDDVEVGDEMALPGSGNLPGIWHGIVTKLEPDYEGRCTQVIGLSRRKAKVEAENKARAEVKISGWRAGDTIEKLCGDCGKSRSFRVESVNKIGRPDSIHADPCPCGRSTAGASFGSADAFRWFMLEPSY
jgi:hypothetical protein